MFLSHLKQDELESIANHTFSLVGDEDPIHNIFFNFRVKLLCQSLMFKNKNNGVSLITSITPSFIEQVICQFNHYYHHSTDDDFLRQKKFYEVMKIEDFDEAPDIFMFVSYLNTISSDIEKAHVLYAFGLILIWSEQNTWSFMSISDSKAQQNWFASFYMASNHYFLTWEPLVTGLAINSAISKKNSKAAKAKHKNSEKTKHYAIQCYVESSYKTVKQAALNISPSVIEYGKNVGFVFSSDYQAIDTIYKWLLSHNKINN